MKKLKNNLLEIQKSINEKMSANKAQHIIKCQINCKDYKKKKNSGMKSYFKY